MFKTMLRSCVCPLLFLLLSRCMAQQQKASTPRAPTLTVRRNLVWQQETPILDFFNDGQNLYVLEPDQIAIYTSDAGQWRSRQTLAVAHERPWPRDLRGRLQISESQIAA